MRLFPLVFVFLITVFSNAQVKLNLESKAVDQSYRYINYTTEQGLPSNETYCVYEDSRGYVWIGTDRGLVKYDGYEFKTYTTLDGLTDNVILSVTEDEKGNIWYVGLNKVQLGYIDPQMHFHEYAYRENLLSYIGNGFSQKIHFNQIHLHKDTITLTNSRFGTISLDEKGSLINLKSRKKVKPRNSYTYITEESTNKRTYILTPDQLVNKINKEASLTNYIYDKNIRIGSYKRQNYRERNPSLIYNDSINVIYDAYNRIEVKNGRITVEKSDYLTYAIQLSKTDYLYSVYKSHDIDGKVYLSNSTDINDEKTELLTGSRIVNAMLDKSNGLWLASLRHGVFYFPSLNSKITKNNDPIESMLPLTDGVIYNTVNTQYFFDKTSGQIHQLETPLDIKTIFQARGNVNIVNHLNCLHKNKIEGYKGYFKWSDSVVYVNYGSYTLMKHELINGILKSKKFDFKLNGIQDMYCMKEDSCLLATNEGIFLFTDSEVQFLDWSPKKRISNVEILSDHTILYAVLGEGLQIVRGDSTIDLSEKDGLFSNTINQLYVDGNTVWISTNKGINSLQITKESIHLNKELGVSRILKSPNVLQLYVEDSTLYLGTDKGFNTFDLRSEYKSRNEDLPLQITTVKINNTIVEDDELKNLEYDQNNLEFTFLGISPKQFANINYKYRLKGLSDDWIYTTDRKATFIKVEPGKYIFELKAENELGNWVDVSNPVYILIHQPIWNRWWFISGSIILIMSVVGGFLYYYISNLQKQKHFLENEQMLSEELNESRQMALSAQLNPHFVFNSLNSIQNFILTKRTELSSDYLSMFSKLMRFVFENSKKLYVPLYDEIEALRLYLELEQVRHNRKFEYSIEIESGLNLRSISIPSLLIQPIIENAIWHGLLHKLEGERLLQVNFKTDKGFLRIEVVDNGVGRGKSKIRPKIIEKQKSSGVELTQQRLSLLSQSTGLNTEFTIVDLFDENEQPCGTQVIISIPRAL